MAGRGHIHLETPATKRLSSHKIASSLETGGGQGTYSVYSCERRNRCMAAPKQHGPFSLYTTAAVCCETRIKQRTQQQCVVLYR